MAGDSSRTEAQRVRVGVLGSLEVVTASGPVEIGPPKQRALLVLLALRAPVVVGAGELTVGLWGDDPPRSALKTMQTYVSGLRRNLPDGTLRTSQGGYQLDIDPDAVDARRFERLVGSARRCAVDGDAARATDMLDEALHLWRGPALADIPDQPAVAAVARRLDELRRSAVEDRAELRLEAGGHQQMAADLEAAVAAEPLRERRWGQLMIALYRSGRQSDALRAYRRLRDVLGEELGIEPSADLAQLEEAILLQRPELLWQPEARRTDAVGVARPPTPQTDKGPRREDFPVTLLLADIADSERLWEEFPAAMSAASSRFTAIVGEEVDFCAGHRLPLHGNVIRAVFDSAIDATAAAVGVQRLMAGELAAGPAPVRGRLALYTGFCEERADDLVGATINRATRLLAVAHGGQTVVSGTTAGIVGERLPDGASWRDLGEHRLWDLERPERLVQLDILGLEGEFGPLDSLDNPALLHNLPTQSTSFVGRTQDRKDVVDLFSKSRLVTLAGPGGVGKTRLAIQVASELLDGSGDGVWIVELAALSDPSRVPTAVAETLGLREEPGRPVTDRLVEVLRRRRLLIILDNCEHLIDACARLADTLLRSCDGVHLLATSREPLVVSWERVFRVPSMSLPDPTSPDAATVAGLQRSEAVTLFKERAIAHRPDFELDDTNAAQVASICRRVDGLPLAIELAAARLRSLPLAEIERRLDDRFRLLTGGIRTALPRQQTLRALIDWSYDLLADGDRRALDRLSVCAGGFDLDLAEAVVAHSDTDKDDVLELVTSLIDKSLLQVDLSGPRVRYRLTETVRQYATERLDAIATVSQATHSAHADAMVSLADVAAGHLEGRDQIEWLQRLDAEQDNLRKAFTFLHVSRAEDALVLAAHLQKYWWLRAVFGEGADVLEAALGDPGAHGPSAARAGALLGLGRIRTALGDFDSATALVEEGLAMARELGRLDLVIDCLAALAVLQIHKGDLAGALSTSEECVLNGRSFSSLSRLGRALRTRGLVRFYLGQTETGNDDFVESLECYRKAGCQIQVASGLTDLACAELETGRLGEAELHARESYRLTVDMKLDPDLPYISATLGTLDLLMDRPEAAAALATEALAVCRRTGDRVCVPVTILILALSASAEAAPERAAFLHGAADASRMEGIEYDTVPARLREEDHSRLRKRLGAEDFDALYNQGWGLRSIEEISAFVRNGDAPTNH